MTSKSPSDRAIRQRELVPPKRLVAAHALVIGVGAIGRQVALQLAALGVPRMSLFDADIVAVENLAPQGYWPEDLGHPKVAVTGSLCERIYPEMELTIAPEKFRRCSARLFQSVSDLAVFVCVDSIATRRIIWQAVRRFAEMFVDGRMSAEVIRVLAERRSVHGGGYDATLFDASEAYTGSCTARSSIYTASIAAGLMVAQFARFLRGLPVVPDQTLNLLAAELTVCMPEAFAA